VEPWLIPALLALVAWSLQRVVAKVALATLSTPQFYFLSAVVSFPVYLPVLLLDPPPLSAFPGAIGVSALVALTFGITTEALRRGPVGRVSPITGLSPALTALLAITILGERMGGVRLTGVATATVAVVLLGYQRRSGQAREGWLMLAIASVVLQGLGAFLSKVVVTPSGPSALLVTSASVQVVVGGALVR
jgi:drug/metabolite transporter (DMT)-like permease